MFNDILLFQTLCKYNFELSKGKKSISNYMNDHLNQYFSDIRSSLDSVSCLDKETYNYILSELKNICESIPNILVEYESGHIETAYNKSNILFDRHQSNFLYCPCFGDRNTHYYRIRHGDFRIQPDDNSKKKKAELFHIKSDMRDKIGAYRYSISGYPCLYLSSGKELAWFECGMPNKFSYCQFEMVASFEDDFKLIDFSYRPIISLNELYQLLMNSFENKKALSLLVNYILTYPFAAACSVKVENRNVKFVEEYVFPQLLMSWIRDNDNYIGVKYKSSRYTNLVDGLGAYNVALPTKKYREDGLDINLTKIMEVSDIGYVDVNSCFSCYNEKIKELKIFVDELQEYRRISAYSGTYIQEMIDYCYCVERIVSSLSTGNYGNSDLLFQYIDRMFDYKEQIWENRNHIIEKCKTDYDNHHYADCFDETVVTNHFDVFYHLVSEIIHKHFAFDIKYKSLDNYETI